MGRKKKYNKISIYKQDPSAARIEVISKKYGIIPVIIDAEDVDKVREYCWYVHKNGNNFYCMTSIYLGNGKQKALLLHRLILDSPDLFIDHINHIGLDNRKSNLRVVTNQENQMNRKPNKNSSSKYKSVYWHKRKSKWYVQIRFNSKRIHIGYFDNEVQAALAYDAKAMELFGEYAKLNFPLNKPK